MEFVLLVASIIAQVGIGGHILWQGLELRTHRLFATYMLAHVAMSFVGLLRLLPTTDLMAARLAAADIVIVLIWGATCTVLAVIAIFYRVQALQRGSWIVTVPLGLASLATVVIGAVYGGLPDKVRVMTRLAESGLYTFNRQTLPIVVFAVGYQLIGMLFALGLVGSVAIRRSGIERLAATIVGLAVLVLFPASVLAREAWAGSLRVSIPALCHVFISLTFSYVILKYRLLPSRNVAVDLVWDNLRDGVIILRTDQFVLNCNRSAANLFGLTKEFLLNKRIDMILRFGALPPQAWLDLWPELQQGRFATTETRYVLGQTEQVVTGEAAPVYDARGEVQGYVWLLYDVTAQRQSEQQIRQRNEALQQALRELQATNVAQNELLETIRRLSAPAVPVLQGIIVLPLSGQISSDRAELIMDNLLSGIQEYDAKVAIIDITGVPNVDTSVAGYLIRAARASALMGCRPVLVGIRPEIAQVIVELGIEMGGLRTFSDLQSGVEYGLRMLGTELVSSEAMRTSIA